MTRDEFLEEFFAKLYFSALSDMFSHPDYGRPEILEALAKSNQLAIMRTSFINIVKSIKAKTLKKEEASVVKMLPACTFNYIYVLDRGVAANDAVKEIKRGLDKFKKHGVATKKNLYIADFEKEISAVNLVWYKNPDPKEPGNWKTPGSSNLTLAEALKTYNAAKSSESHAFRKYASHKFEKINDLFVRLKDGLTEDVEIITVKDTTLGESMILDGAKRLLALYSMFLKDKEGFSRKFLDQDARFKITLFEFESAVGGIICLRDFIPIYYKKDAREALYDGLQRFWPGHL